MKFVISALVLLFIYPVVSIVVCAFTGWLIGLVFTETLNLVSMTILGQIIPHWQLGAGLGFFGSFFKSALVQEAK